MKRFVGTAAIVALAFAAIIGSAPAATAQPGKAILRVHSAPISGIRISGHRTEAPYLRCGQSCGGGITNYEIVRNEGIRVVLMAHNVSIRTSLAVRSEPIRGITMKSWGGTCRAHRCRGDTNYTVTRIENIRFLRWAGCDRTLDLNGDGIARTCVVSVSPGDSKTVIAQYEKPHGIRGHIVAPLEAQSRNDTYAFKRWNGACAETKGPQGRACRVAIPAGAARTITAHFVPMLPTISPDPPDTQEGNGGQPTPETAGEPEPQQGKVTLCHATGSQTNPYVLIEIAAAGAYHGHLGSDHQNGEDIIPPFVWQGTTYSQNWDAEGQAIFAAGCQTT